MLKDTPTVAETLPGYELAVWYGAFGPKGLPAEIQKRLNAEINAIMMTPDVKARMEAMAVEPLNATPEAFGAMMRADLEKYTKLVKELTIRAE